MLYYIISYYTISYYIISCYIRLCYITLYRIILCCFMLHYIILHCIISYCILLHSIILHRVIYYIISYHIILNQNNDINHKLPYLDIFPSYYEVLNLFFLERLWHVVSFQELFQKYVIDWIKSIDYEIVLKESI